jgi:hypothetical protein
MSLFRNIWVLFFIGLSQFSFGQKTAKYSNEYMNLGAGARAFGIGLQLNQIKIDYAFTDLGNTSSALYSHVFSINFSIYKED